MCLCAPPLRRGWLLRSQLRPFNFFSCCGSPHCLVSCGSCFPTVSALFVSFLCVPAAPSGFLQLHRKTCRPLSPPFSLSSSRPLPARVLLVDSIVVRVVVSSSHTLRSLLSLVSVLLALLSVCIVAVHRLRRTPVSSSSFLLALCLLVLLRCSLPFCFPAFV